VSLPFALVHAEPDPVAERAGRERRAARFAEQAGRGFARLTVLPVIVVVAWLVPGLPLLLGGFFEPVPELLIAAPLAAALAVNLLHRVPGQWLADPGRPSERGWPAFLGIAGTVVIAVGFLVWQLALNSPSVIAARMPGAYFQTGFWIAQHGSLPIPGSLGAFGGAHAGLRLASIGFAAHGHSVLPEVTPGLPLLLAGGFWTSGTGGGAVISPVLGCLAVLSFGGLVGRLAGRQWAPAGALVLALTLPELYTSRDAFSETAVQVLLFGGLSLVVDALAVSGPGRPAVSLGKSGPSETTATAPPPDAKLGTVGESSGQAEADRTRTAPLPVTSAAARGRRAPGQASALLSRLLAVGHLPSRAANALTAEAMLAGLGGLALGLTSLMSLASLPYLVPVIPVAGVLVVARRTVGAACAIGIIVGCGYGLAGAYLLARPPAGPQTMPLKVIGLDAAGLVLLTIAAVLLMRAPRARRLVSGVVARRPLRWLPGIASMAIVAALAWLAVRPYLQTVRGNLGPDVARYVANLQRIAGLRVDPARLYSEDTLYWVIWYAGIATVLLGGFGAAILLRRCLRDLLSWRDASGTALNWALPLVIVLGGTAAVLWQPFTVPDQPWASRRLVPVVIPGLILLATWAATWLTRRARDRGAGVATAAMVGAFCVGAMLLPSVSTSFGFGLTHAGTRGGLQPTAGGLAQHSVGAHEADAVRSVCSVIGRSSAVLIVDRRIAAVFGQAIRGMCGVPVAWVARKAPGSTVRTALAGIARSGRRAVLLGDSPQETGAFGGTPTLIMSLVTTQYPHELTQPPGAPWRARYRIWMTSPSAPNAGV
jgi:peptidoglycan hydrolase-like protein with peptidoglycan-binding domain